MGRTTGNRRIDFGSDPSHDADPGILKVIFAVAGEWQLEEYCGDRLLSACCWRSPSGSGYHTAISTHEY